MMEHPKNIDALLTTSCHNKFDNYNKKEYNVVITGQRYITKNKDIIYNIVVVVLCLYRLKMVANGPPQTPSRNPSIRRFH